MSINNIKIGSTTVQKMYFGDFEIEKVYLGSTVIYEKSSVAILTAITMDSLTWVTDVHFYGGTATSANCSYVINAHYNNGTIEDVTSESVVTGSLNVPYSTATTRHSAGTLELTASYSGFTATGSTSAYQEAFVTHNKTIIYTTTDNQKLNRNFGSYSWNGTSFSSHEFSNGVGFINFVNDVKNIPAQTFSGLTTLATIDIPITVSGYGASAFEECTGMVEFKIPSNITSIGSSCFKLTSGTLIIEDNQYACSGYGKTTSYVDGSSAFSYSFAGKFCGSTYKSYNGINFDKIIVTGSTTMYVGADAFHASPATEIIFGSNVNYFGGMAIARMTNEGYGTILKPFEKLTIANTGSTTFGTYFGFYGVNGLKDIKYYPRSSNLTMRSQYFSVNNGTVHYKSGSTGIISGLPSGWSVVYDL